jgi:hypothetical protein
MPYLKPAYAQLFTGNGGFPRILSELCKRLKREKEADISGPACNTPEDPTSLPNLKKAMISNLVRASRRFGKSELEIVRLNLYLVAIHIGFLLQVWDIRVPTLPLLLIFSLPGECKTTRK